MMLGTSMDRTYEVERRLRAIHIRSEDSCCFFKARDGTAAKLRHCWYCQYAAFEQENTGIGVQGLCKFKN